MLIIELLFKSLIFLLAAIVCFYIPGVIFLERIKKDWESLEKNILALPLGLVLFTFLAWLFASLHLRFLLPLTLLIFLIKFLKSSKIDIPPLKNKAVALIIFIGVIAQNLISFPSGLFFGDKLEFWGVAGRDGMWYLTLTEELKNNFPPLNPSYAGELLKNYHYFYYLAQAEISRLTSIPVIDINFRFFPLFVSLTFGLAIYLLTKKLNKNNSAALWPLFFAYFSGSFGYIPRLIGYGRGGWETVFWSMQPFSMLQNPQLGFSFTLLVVWLILLIEYIKSKNKKYLLPVILIAATLPEYKIFGGTLLLGTFFVVSVFEVLIFRKIYLFLSFIASAILFLIIFLPVSAKAPSFFIFEPFWFVRSMIVSPDRLNWVDLELRRQSFAYFHNWPKVVMIETLSLLIFTFGNLGTKFLGFFAFPKIFAKIKNKEYSLPIIGILAFIIASFTIPLLFLQSGVAWNTIQYLYYFVFALSLLSGLVVGSFKPRIFISLAIIIFSIPTSLELIYSFYSNPAASYLSRGEFEALNFLKNRTPKNSVVLAYEFNPYLKEKFDSPIPISIYDSTSYVSAFSARPVYFADELIEGNAGYNIEERKNNQKLFFHTDNTGIADDFLKKNHIKYIYLLKDDKFGQKINFPADSLNFTTPFENEEVKIYKTDVK